MIFDSLVARLGAAPRDLRLDTLLAYSSKLPAPPEELVGAADLEAHRVAECQTPVFLWLGRAVDGTVAMHADVPRESPTVRGYVGLLRSKIHGATPPEVAAVPNDLLDRLGLAEALGMTRTQGLTAILGRIKRLAAAGD
ncbi:MAG: SufE family protein [Gemmatimonadota bacterium]